MHPTLHGLLGLLPGVSPRFAGGASGALWCPHRPLGWTLVGLRVRDGPGFPGGLDRLPESSQVKGEPNCPMRWQDADGHKFVIRNSSPEAMVDKEKSFSVGSPLTGKQVGFLPPTSGSQPEVRGARAGSHSSSGVTFHFPAMSQGTSPRLATWPKTSFQGAFWFFQRSGVPWGHP